MYSHMWQFQNIPGFSLFLRKAKQYKTFKVHYLSNSPLVQLNTSASDCKGAGNIPESHFVNAFSALPSHSELCHWRHKSAVTSRLSSVEGADKNQLQPG